MERMVKVVNMTNSNIVLNDNSYGLKKIFPKKGAIQMVSFDILQNMLWSNVGCSNMFKKGMLYIENMQDKIDLGLEEEGTKTPTNIRVLTDAQILTLLKVKPMKEFLEELRGLSQVQIEGIVDYAINNKIVDVEKNNILKELTGRDIIALIARANENQLIDERIAKREASREADRKRDY